MKRLEEFVKGSCAYTIVILTFFYLFALASDFNETKIGFGRFALIFLFGTVICAAQYLFKLNIHKLLATAAHYCVLLFAFSMIFLVSGILGGKGSDVFVSIIVFTVLYAILFVAIYYIKRGISAIDGKIDKKHPQNTKKTAPKSEYSPKFK